MTCCASYLTIRLILSLGLVIPSEALSPCARHCATRGKFRALVLLDPVLFVPSRLIDVEFRPRDWAGRKIHPLIAGAMKRRRRTFDDLESVFRGYRNRRYLQIYER